MALYNAGVCALKAGDKLDAKVKFEKAAKLGHPKSVHNLALLTEPEEPERAVQLYRAAAALGMAEAQVIKKVVF